MKIYIHPAFRKPYAEPRCIAHAVLKFETSFCLSGGYEAETVAFTDDDEEYAW